MIGDGKSDAWLADCWGVDDFSRAYLPYEDETARMVGQCAETAGAPFGWQILAYKAGITIAMRQRSPQTEPVALTGNAGAAGSTPAAAIGYNYYMEPKPNPGGNMARQPVRAVDVQAKPVKWCWRDRIPEGEMTVVAGRKDRGKGLFTIHVAAELSRQGVKILHSSWEDSFGIMRTRYEAAKADLNNVALYRMRVPQNFRELEALVERKGVRLLILDPVAASLSHGLTRHSDNIRDGLNPLFELCEKTGLSVLWVDHTNKRVRPGDDPLDAIGGSGSGLPAACRAALLFGQDPQDPDGRYLCTAKMNLREWSYTEAIRFEIDSVELDTVDSAPFLLLDNPDAIQDPMGLFESRSSRKSKEYGGAETTKRAMAAEWLTNYLAKNGRTKAGRVGEEGLHAGLSRKTLMRAAEDMQIDKQPPGGGRTCTWDLPAVLKVEMGLAKKVKDTRTVKRGGKRDLETLAKMDEQNDDLAISDDDLSALLGDADNG